MVQFIIRRIAAGLVVLCAISFLTYFLLYFSSSNIARNILGEFASQEQVAQKEAELGLDQPLIPRFLDWAGHAITGDFGRSWFTTEPVATAITNRLPVTLTLVIVAILLIALLATVLGMAAAVKRGWIDRTVQTAAIVGDAIPGFVLAIILVTLFAIQLKLFPATSSIAPDADSSELAKKVNTYVTENAWFAPLFRLNQMYYSNKKITVEPQLQQAIPSIYNYAPAK